MGKILKFLGMLILCAVIFSAASVGGVFRDRHVAAQNAIALAEEQALLASQPKEVASPYEQAQGGAPFDLQMDYEVQIVGDDLQISIVTNLPDTFELNAELSNVEEVKKELGYANISASALTQEQMNEINAKTYSKKEMNFVTKGVCNFYFSAPPTGQLDLKVTSPITSLQPSTVQHVLGEKGVNLQGSYVIYLDNMDDRSINYTASFLFEEQEDAVQ